MSKEINSRGEIILYENDDGGVGLDVRLDKDTIWLTQKQMGLIFDKDTDTIGLHLRNIFKEGELEERATTEESSVVQLEGKRHVSRRVRFYNLDAIISVGYRVNSKRGTQFRIWATSILHEHIVKGYTVNQARLNELSQTVKLIADTVGRRDLSGDEATALLSVIGEYNRALGLLDDYDHQRVSMPETTGKCVYPLGYDEAMRIVNQLRSEFVESDVFGIEKDQGLDSALGAVMQTAGGVDVYPSLEEKAANLLYFMVKNHAFVDGNKRIAAAIFLWFLERNHALISKAGKEVISDAALVAMTLMIAESSPGEKDVLVRIVVHLLAN
ncbi:virulence protein RhuM/Fic/DOC family protein [bacterium]|jgi:prophage maintenance system killer protein|nr:virulence protein RhuM/Fic/DOC family protein [bacterium]